MALETSISAMSKVDYHIEYERPAALMFQNLYRQNENWKSIMCTCIAWLHICERSPPTLWHTNSRGNSDYVCKIENKISRIQVGLEKREKKELDKSELSSLLTRRGWCWLEVDKDPLVIMLVHSLMFHVQYWCRCMQHRQFYFPTVWRSRHFVNKIRRSVPRQRSGFRDGTPEFR